MSYHSYGQTGGGKTYTMEGGDGERRGMIPRAVEQIFRKIEELKKLDWSFKMKAEFFEVCSCF